MSSRVAGIEGLEREGGRGVEERIRLQTVGMESPLKGFIPVSIS